VLERAEREYEAAFGGMPIFDPYAQAGATNWLQPCYLDDGAPPADPDIACAERAQPRFDGRQSYYSSGFIAPSGPRGNTFDLPLAEDIEPGKYAFYCIVHFPDMQGSLEVKPASEELPPAGDVNANARDEIEKLASPLREAFADAKGGRAEAFGERLELPLAGYHSQKNFTVALDEFVPKIVTTRPGEPVTWTIVGAHTVSFDVPRYLAIYTVAEDGTVRRNPTVDRAAGGSPKAPPVDFLHEPYRIDGGTWDGSGFISSGLLGSEPYARYTLRFSKAGRYRYACLVHPSMVGTVDVRA
jgi:plastocyanin